MLTRQGARRVFCKNQSNCGTRFQLQSAGLESPTEIIKQQRFPSRMFNCWRLPCYSGCPLKPDAPEPRPLQTIRWNI
jgi:hypothetical protein